MFVYSKRRSYRCRDCTSGSTVVSSGRCSTIWHYIISKRIGISSWVTSFRYSGIRNNILLCSIQISRLCIRNINISISTSGKMVTYTLTIMSVFGSSFNTRGSNSTSCLGIIRIPVWTKSSIIWYRRIEKP